MKAFAKLLSFMAVSMVLAVSAMAQDAKPASVILITNAKIFDGVSDQLIEGKNVLIEANKISRIEANIRAPRGAQVIDAGGRTLTPGLIFMHEHMMYQSAEMELLLGDTRYSVLVGAQIARDYLANGITTVRDASGNSFALKRAIDNGIATGPRIYPSGPMLSQTSGHSDYRIPSQPSVQMGATTSGPMLKGDMVVADGRAEVLKAARENLRRGASQIKLAVGGGTGTISDPIEVTEYTAEEIRAAVQVASDFGTYVMTHVYNNHGIRRAVDNGVKSIEHGNLVDRDTLQYMKDHDVWLSPQVLVYTYIPSQYTEAQKAKHRAAFAGIDNMFKAAKEIGFDNIVMGSDIIGNAEAVKTINVEFTNRAKWFTPFEIMRMATSKGAELLAMSGFLNPYPGKLGVIEEGAYADILLVDGNPLKDVSVMTDPEANFDLIMKDGKIYKNTIQ